MRRINAAVIFVLLLFALIYGTTMFLVVVPWLSFSVPGIFHGALLSVITAMALWCYLKCVFQDPGTCSLDWRPDEEATDSLIPVKKDGGPRHCRKCVPPRPKPPRAHHCKECNRCILRMDHHCVWVNNCVGHLNYKAFILFLMYALLSCVHCLGLLFAHTLYSMHGKHREKAALRAAVRLTENRHSAVSASANFAVMAAILQMTCISLLMPLCIALAILFGWHMYLVVKNLSTIEFYEGIRTAKRQERSAEQTKYHPYDLGVADNVLQVLGPHPSRWCCPGNGSLVGSGYVYPTNFES